MMFPKLEKRDREALKRRFEASREHDDIKNFDYIVKGPKGNDEAVLCKTCNAPLVSMVVDDRWTTTKRKGKQTIIRERLVQAQTPGYDSIIIEMDDGSAHETPVCKSCKVKLRNARTFGTVQAILDADLYRLYQVDEPDAKGQRRMDWLALSKRKIVGIA